MAGVLPGRHEVAIGIVQERPLEEGDDGASLQDAHHDDVLAVVGVGGLPPLRRLAQAGAKDDLAQGCDLVVPFRAVAVPVVDRALRPLAVLLFGRAIIAPSPRRAAGPSRPPGIRTAFRAPRRHPAPSSTKIRGTCGQSTWRTDSRPGCAAVSVTAPRCTAPPGPGPASPAPPGRARRCRPRRSATHRAPGPPRRPGWPAPWTRTRFHGPAPARRSQ